MDKTTTDQLPIESRGAFEELLGQIHGERRRITEIDENLKGSQGYSGSKLRYFTVTSRDARGNVH